LIKQDIVHHVIERTGLPRTKAEAAVDTVFEGLKQALAAGERIELRGFGVFSVRARKTGIGRNPRTGTEVSIAPARLCASSPARNCTAELSTRQIAETEAAVGLPANKKAAKTGGIAHRARVELESKTGRRVVTGENYLPPGKAKKILNP
jgi:nucleoid DNA-binding protein